MYVLAAIFLAAVSAYSQTPAHVRALTRSCKGELDRVYGKSDGVYYACIKGKEVSSKRKGAIPRNLISAFDANMKRSRAHMAKKGAAKPEPQVEAAPRVRVEMARAGVISTVETLPSAAPAKPRTPIADEKVRGIPIGTDREVVIGKLGEPYMKISGSVERFTYLLTSRNTAQLAFENGKLNQLRIVPAR